eukprot:Nk52_evm1s1146 gene=Nk52_evmTU1s1146
MRKYAQFTWTTEAQTAFDKLKDAVTSAPVLRPPDFARPFILHCDASGHALGAALMQEFDDGVHPIAFHSRTLADRERNYDIRDRENLAIVDAFRTFRPYVLHHHTSVHSDHCSLQYLMTQPHLKDRQARWIEELSYYDFTILYRKGSSNVVADPLSRLAALCAALVVVPSLPSPPASFAARVKLAYETDPDFPTFRNHR